MRKNERPSYCNKVSTDYLVKNFSKLIGIQSNIMSHILYLVSLATNHMIALDARKSSDTRLKNLRIEIPYFGCIETEIHGNNVVATGFTFEDEFKEDLIKAVTTGTSEFSSKLDKRLIDKLQEKYNEYL